MAEAFQPRFVDLVRNTTTTVGRDAFVLGPAVTGFASLSAALEPGDSFYYSTMGIEKPGEREVGRGTLLVNGTVSRDPINGVLTYFTGGTKTIALIAAAEWFNLVQAGGGSGAVGESAASGVAADGTSDDRTALAAADVAAAGEDKILVVRRGVHRVASDLTFTSQVRFARGAQLKPAAGVKVHFAQGYIADDWSHCFDISAAGSSVTGDRAPTGYVTPQHFGADPADPLVDDRAAIEAATEYGTLSPIRNEYANGFPVKFPNPGLGNYYLTKTRPIYVARTTHWFTDARSYLREYGSTEIRGANGLDAVVFCFAPGGLSAPAEYETVNQPGDAVPGIGKSYSGIRSRFSDLSFRPESGGLVKYGFVHNTICFLERCTASGFSQGQFYAHSHGAGSIANAFDHPGTPYGGGAPSYNGTANCWGNTNGSTYTSCYAQDGVPADPAVSLAHGFIAHGSTSGTVHYFGCDAAGNQGAGFLLNDNIGCELHSTHSAENYRSISHGGSNYICIKYHSAAAANEPGAGASWRTYWFKIDGTPSVVHAAWASGTVYHPCGGVNVCAPVARTALIAHYTEGAGEVGVVLRDRSMVVGQYAETRTPWHGEFNGARIVSSGGPSISPIGYTGRLEPDDPATEYGINLGVVGGYSNGRILQLGDARDDAANKSGALRYLWNDTRKRYEWQDASNGSRAIYGISGNGFTGTGYGGIAQAHLWANGLYLADGSATGLTVGRMRSAASLSGITDAAYGAAVRGDIWFYTQPTANGSIGAVCTAAGTIGSTATIKEFGPVAKLVTLTQAAYDALGTPDPDTYYFITA